MADEDGSFSLSKCAKASEDIVFSQSILWSQTCANYVFSSLTTSPFVLYLSQESDVDQALIISSIGTKAKIILYSKNKERIAMTTGAPLEIQAMAQAALAGLALTDQQIQQLGLLVVNHHLTPLSVKCQ